MCFVCGRQNPWGLKLDFYADEESGEVRADFSVPDAYQGYPGVVHGGIVAAILDEISGRAVLLHCSEENLKVTARLTVRYRRPTPTETPLTAVGWVERESRVGARVGGEIRDPDGRVTAECEATLTGVPKEIQAQWAEEQAYWKVYD
jgi:uncharacterized protein (TIGR00369 family)